MSDNGAVGLVLVGPDACALKPGGGLRTVRVRAEGIVPLEDDLPALVNRAPNGLFEGPDRDRWRHLPRGVLAQKTEMLWAASQVETAGVAARCDGFERLIVLGWCSEVALIPTVRALVGRGRPIVVVLGGPVRAGHPADRRNHTVIADLARRGVVANLIHAEQPLDCMPFLMELLDDQPGRLRSAKPVDVGTVLDLEPHFVDPAAAVPVRSLGVRPFGKDPGLPGLLCTVAAHATLREVITGPPAEVPGPAGGGVDELRRRLPDGPVFEQLRTDIAGCLDAVVFQGDEPLVEQVARRLRPVVEQIQEWLDLCDGLEQRRLHQLRTFSAVGIDYTCQRLRALLDDVRQTRSIPTGAAARKLLSGEGPEKSALTAWRTSFGGLPSHIVRDTVSGGRVAKDLVVERYQLFKAEFASILAESVAARIRHCRDEDAPLPTETLRMLHSRATQVRDRLKSAQGGFEAAIERGCVRAIGSDGLCGWAADDPEALQDRLVRVLRGFPVTAEIDRLAMIELSRRPLGMASDADFEGYLEQLSTYVGGLPDLGTPRPSHAEVALAVVDGLDPLDLVEHLADEAPETLQLRLRRPADPDLLAWFQSTDIAIDVHDGPGCATWWRAEEAFTQTQAEGRRRATSEHWMQDLALPPPEGDSAVSLAGWVRAASLLVVGIALGDVHAMGLEGAQSTQLLSTAAALPEGVLLPHGGLHLLASDAEYRSRLRARISLRIEELAEERDAMDTVVKLLELGRHGLAPSLARQLGWQGPRLVELSPLLTQLLQRTADLALVALVDRLDSKNLAEVMGQEDVRVAVSLDHLGSGSGL